MPKDEGRWIQLGAREGSDGKKHGGSPVFVRDGRIVKGAPSLTGKKVGAFHEPAEQGGHRAQLHQEKEYQKAKWAKRARAEGFDPQALHALAEDFLRHDAELVKRRNDALGYARRISKQMGYSLQTLKARASHGIDSDAVRHLDDVSESVASAYPELFPPGSGSPEERLFDMLAEGNAKPISAKEAYQHAFDYLQEHGAGREEDDEPIGEEPLWDAEEPSPPLWDEETTPDWLQEGASTPFARQGEAHYYSMDDHWSEASEDNDPQQARRYLGILCLYVFSELTRPALVRKAKRLLRALPHMPPDEAVDAWQRVREEQGRLVDAMLRWREKTHQQIRMRSLIQVVDALSGEDEDGRPGPAARRAMQAVLDLEPDVLDDALLHQHFHRSE